MPKNVTPVSTCWSLVRSAAMGSPEGREAFVRRYEPVVRAYLAARWRVGFDHERVDEATQETFLQCLRKGGALERVEAGRPGGFRAYFYGIARNIACVLERRLTREVGGDLEQNAADDVGASQAFDAAWTRMLVTEAREVLERRARTTAARHRLEAIRMRYEQGLPSRDIADRLEMKVERVYEMLAAARREFRAALMEIMAGYYPGETKPEIERRCLEQLAAL